MPGRNSKKSRFHAIFSQAANVLADGSRAVLRPETMTDYRTICNYWYDWRRIYYGVGIKSPDPEVRRKATVVLDARIKVDTDNQGRIILTLEPRITPALQATIERVVDPFGPATILSSGQGQSAPSASADEAAHYLRHVKPWQDFLKGLGGVEAMLKCLDSIPRDLRREPDLASIDDLPDPASAEATAWRERFKQLVAGG